MVSGLILLQKKFNELKNQTNNMTDLKKFVSEASRIF